MGRFKLLLFMAAMVSLSANAKSKEPELSENLKSGVAAMYDGNGSDARDFFLKELEKNPKSGETYYWLGILYQSYGDLQSAQYDFEKALEYLPSKYKTYLYSARLGRAEVLLSRGDTATAMADLDIAEKLSDKPVGVYTQRANVLFYQGKRDESDASYRKALNLEPDNWSGLMGMGRSHLRRLQYDKAIEYFDKVTSLYPSSSDAYAFKAETYKEMKNYDRATDNIILAYQCEPYQRKAMHEMDQLNEEATALIIPKLKIEILKNNEASCWNYHLGYLFEYRYDYKNAILSYSEGLKRQFESFMALRLANCYDYLGHYKNAKKYADLAVRLDSTSMDAKHLVLTNMLYEGDYEKLTAALADYQKNYPDYTIGYEKKAVCLQRMKKYDESADQFSMALVLSPDNTYLFFARGEVYRAMGKTKMFENDMKKCIDLDPNQSESYPALAYAYLGDREKAIAVMNQALENDQKGGQPQRPGANDYRWSVLYSILGDTDLAIDHLEKSLQAGLRDTEDIEHALYFSRLRENARYQPLMKKYHAIQEEEIKELDKINTSTPSDSFELKSSEQDRMF